MIIEHLIEVMRLLNARLSPIKGHRLARGVQYIPTPTLRVWCGYYSPPNPPLDKSLATVPLALQQLATMSATIPASMLMKRLGRQLEFIIGVLIGMAGAGVGVYAVFSGRFPLFCLATLLFGVFNGFVGFYRFAAADAASEKSRAQAISFVVAGGVLAALVGPELAKESKDWFAPVLYAGSLGAIAVLQLISLVLLLWIDIPPCFNRGRVQDLTSTGSRALVTPPAFCHYSPD